MEPFKYLLLLIYFLTSSVIFSQVDLSIAENMIGNWQGKYTIDSQINFEEIRVEWAIKHAFLQIDVIGQEETRPQFSWYQRYLLTIDEDEKIIGWYFDESGYAHYTTFTGKTEEGKIILKNRNSDYTFNVSFEVKNNKLYRYVTYGKKGEKVSVVEAIFDRVI